MTPPFAAILIIVSAVATGIGVGLMRRFALSRAILDIPNQRSSHAVPTPRGGGLAVVVTTVAGLALTRGMFPEEDGIGLTVMIGGSLVALLGWLDDCYKVGTAKRFVGYFLLSLFAAFQLAPATAGLPEKAFMALIVAWSINLYNFMDGIDGLAGTEAAMAGFAGAALALWFAAGPVVLPLLLGSASLGFLWWNWPPARIFMGDVCSGFYGYAFGCLVIASGWGFRGGAGMWLLLLGMFWFDATFTLLRRMARGERVWQAHRSHFYQQAVQAGWSHRGVVLMFMACNALLIGLACFLAMRTA